MAKTKKSKPRSKHRASWKGHLTFGLVSFPVQAFNAINREQSDIHFHQLHATCHRRIKYKKVCPVHGEVTQDEIVSGYEHHKGKYVEIDPEELDALRSKAERSLTIDAFIEPDEVDPLYFDGRMYYLVPASTAADEPYAVVAEALEREEKVGIGQIVFSGKDQLVLVRPYEGVLHMAMLNFDEEIKPPSEVIVTAIKKPKGLTRQIGLAQTLIRNWTASDFDFRQYDDRYRQRVKELIDAKLEGRETVEPREEEEEEGVINLMDALKRSVEEMRGGGRKKTRRRRSA